MEKTTVVVVLVIEGMSSRYWAMEARVRERESDGEDGGSSEREKVSESERVRVFFFFFNKYMGQVWIISIPYPHYSGNIHTLPN